MNGRAVPVPGSRAEVAAPEQVLRRAIELTGDGPAGDVALSPRHLQQVAAELEVPSWAVTAALAERQVSTGLPPAGPLSRVVGPVAVAGWRRIEARPDRVEALVAEWLESGYALRVRQLGDGTMVATHRPGIAGSVARAARSVQGGRDLTGPRGEVRAVVVADEPSGSSVVSVLVDVRARRRAAAQAGSALGLFGVAGAIAGAVVATPVLLVGAPLSLGAGVLVAAAHHRSVVRAAAEEVEATLDNVARRERPVGPVRGLARSMGRRIRPAPGA